MVIDLDLAFEDAGGVPASKDAAISHLQQIPVSASLKRRYLRAWAERTQQRVEPDDYGKLTGHREKR